MVEVKDDVIGAASLLSERPTRAGRVSSNRKPTYAACFWAAIGKDRGALSPVRERTGWVYKGVGMGETRRPLKSGVPPIDGERRSFSLPET